MNLLIKLAIFAWISFVCLSLKDFNISYHSSPIIEYHENFVVALNVGCFQKDKRDNNMFCFEETGLWYIDVVINTWNFYIPFVGILLLAFILIALVVFELIHFLVTTTVMMFQIFLMYPIIWFIDQGFILNT